jgi:hypothetical protein
MQNSRNFDISATESELKDKYLVQRIDLKELSMSYNILPKSRLRLISSKVMLN